MAQATTYTHAYTHIHTSYYILHTNTQTHTFAQVTTYYIHTRTRTHTFTQTTTYTHAQTHSHKLLHTHTGLGPDVAGKGADQERREGLTNDEDGFRESGEFLRANVDEGSGKEARQRRRSIGRRGGQYGLGEDGGGRTEGASGTGVVDGGGQYKSGEAAGVRKDEASGVGVVDGGGLEGGVSSDAGVGTASDAGVDGGGPEGGVASDAGVGTEKDQTVDVAAEIKAAIASARTTSYPVGVAREEEEKGRVGQAHDRGGRGERGSSSSSSGRSGDVSGGSIADQQGLAQRIKMFEAVVCFWVGCMIVIGMVAYFLLVPGACQWGKGASGAGGAEDVVRAPSRQKGGVKGGEVGEAIFHSNGGGGSSGNGHARMRNGGSALV